MLRESNGSSDLVDATLVINNNETTQNVETTSSLICSSYDSTSSSSLSSHNSITTIRDNKVINEISLALNDSSMVDDPNNKFFLNSTSNYESLASLPSNGSSMVDDLDNNISLNNTSNYESLDEQIKLYKLKRHNSFLQNKHAVIKECSVKSENYPGCQGDAKKKR